MSTPIDLNVVMPYGVTVVGDGTNNPKLAAPHPKQMQNFGLKLPPGPCRIAASWEGDEKVGVVVQTSGTRNYRTVGNIPERSGGGVPVRAWSQSGPSRTTTCTSTDTTFRRARRAPWKFTRSTSKRSFTGGGVGGHPEFGCAAGDQVVRGEKRRRERLFDQLGRFLRAAAERCVHHLGYLPGSRSVGTSHYWNGWRLPLPVEECGPGADSGAFQRRSSQGRNALPERADRRYGRCGRDYHHLPADVAQGVAA